MFYDLLKYAAREKQSKAPKRRWPKQQPFVFLLFSIEAISKEPARIQMDFFPWRVGDWGALSRKCASSFTPVRANSFSVHSKGR